MSASHRSLARLPLAIFSDLITHKDDDSLEPKLLRDAICSKLKQPQHNIPSVTTVGELLRMSSTALLRAIDPLLTHEECKELLHRICTDCAPFPVSALSLYQKMNSSNRSTSSESVRTISHIPTGMTALDACLRGGFRVGTISELVGRASVGKTQLGLQLCIMAAKYNQGSIYIDTEKKLSLSRLKEMADERAASSFRSEDDEKVDDESFSYDGTLTVQKENVNAVNMKGMDHYSSQKTSRLPFKSAHEVLENVTVQNPRSTNELMSVVAGIEEEVLLRNQEAEDSPATKYPVRLVLLDSIAAPARRDFGKESAPKRASALLQLAQTLKRVADQLQVAVVVINQVGLDEEKAMPPCPTPAGSDYVAVQAALGTSWHHCLSTRLLMEHERDPHRLHSAIDDIHSNLDLTITEEEFGNNDIAWNYARGQVRRATVVKSNVAGNTSMNYEITALGLVELKR